MKFDNNEWLGVQSIQAVLLEIGITVCDLLESEGFAYSIIDGTLLGAVRHQGFIPWDDDFDILLFDDTYDEACRMLKDKLPSYYLMEDFETEPRYFHGWNHVKDKRTILHRKEWHQDDIYVCKGAALDLYKAKKMCHKDLDDYLRQEERDYISRLYSAGLISKGKLDDKVRKLNSRGDLNDLDTSEQCREGFGRITKYVTNFIYLEEMFPQKKYLFNGRLFCGPGDAEAILTRSYGDYMSLPPEEKRVPAFAGMERLEDSGVC